MEPRGVQDRVPSAPRSIVQECVGSACGETRGPELHRGTRHAELRGCFINRPAGHHEQNDAAAPDDTLGSCRCANPALEQRAVGVWSRSGS